MKKWEKEIRNWKEKRRTIEITSKQNKQTRRLRYYYFLLLLCTIPVRVPDRENCIYR